MAVLGYYCSDSQVTSETDWLDGHELKLVSGTILNLHISQILFLDSKPKCFKGPDDRAVPRSCLLLSVAMQDKRRKCIPLDLSDLYVPEVWLPRMSGM